MTERKTIEIELNDLLGISLQKIEFTDYKGPPDNPHRAFFEFRLRLDEGYQPDDDCAIHRP